MIEISILIAVIGCFITMCGWLYKHDSRIIEDAQWRGMINTKLDYILSVTRVIEDMEIRLSKLESKVEIMETR